MTEALKCPECAAPLDPPADGARTMRCPYCQCTVLLSNTSGATVVDRGAGLGVAIGRAVEMAQATAQLRAGNKIEAIRIYRQIHGSDLVTAKAAVERLAAGQNAGVRVAAARAANPRLRVGITVAIFGVVIAVMAVVGTVVRVLDSALPNQQTNAVPSMPAPPAPFIPPPPLPPPPAFADQVLEFGSEGIGAGQFKDARSIGLDGAGHIFVGEYDGGRIQVFDADGKFLKTWRIDSKNVLSNLAVNREGT
jgi:ribosomal protein L7/L12